MLNTLFRSAFLQGFWGQSMGMYVLIDWSFSPSRRRPILLEMNINLAVCLIGVVQLALRHPHMEESPIGHMTRDLILALIDNIDPSRGDVHKFLMMGFDPNCDQ